MNLEEVYEGYVEKVYKFFYVKCLDRDLAEDLTSATFMSYIERTKDESFVVNDTVKYLYGIMRKTWLTYLRGKYRHHEQSVETIEDFESYATTEIDDFEGVSIKQRAKKIIELLPDKQKQIVGMRLLQELSIKEITIELRKDSNYVKTTYKRGLKRMKRILEEQGQLLDAKEVI